jgi:hypothetical protein
MCAKLRHVIETHSTHVLALASFGSSL